MHDVLCVFRDTPLDASTDSVRARRLARIVCGDGPATAVVLHEAAPDEQARLAFELGACVIALGVAKHSRWRAVATSLARPRRSWPPVRSDVAKAQKAIAGVLEGSEPGVVWCDGGEAWLALPRSLRSRAVVDFVDLPGRNRRELARVAVHRLRRRITGVGGVDASAFAVLHHAQGGVRNRHLEHYVAARAAAVVVASPREAHGRKRFRVVRTGVDDPGAAAPPDDPYPVAHFVFPGSFLYPPHQDAAEWFALYALPPLRRLVPASRVVYAGECPDWMFDFGVLHGIEVTGPIDDLGAVLDSRSIVVAPIRAGSGTIVEVVDAWARQVPVVATSRGVEGLDAHDGDDVLVADDAAEFAARCSLVARSPELRARLTTRGRERYEADFTWDVIGAELRAWLKQIGQ